MKKNLIRWLLVLAVLLPCMVVVSMASETVRLDLSQGSIALERTADGVQYTQGGTTVPVGDAVFLIRQSDTSAPTSNTITVSGGEVAVSVMGVNISSSTASPISVESGAHLLLTLLGDNTLKATGKNCAGLEVPAGAELTVKGTGTLSATGGSQGAGIGGDYGNGGIITISGGTVTATGGAGGSGIGGGYNGNGGTITIEGGEVLATGGSQYSGPGAGIGGGYNGNGGTITIKGGRVTGIGGSGARGGNGIGGGHEGRGGTITITNGTLHAKGGKASYYSNGAGIGGDGATITISGGTVNADDIVNRDGIYGKTISVSGGEVIAYGSFGGGICGTSITIEDGTVNAKGYEDAGIGGSTITISGGTVTASGGSRKKCGYAGINGDTITISGGIVNAKGGTYAEGYTATGGAGIGGASSGSGGIITISGGTVTATGGYYAAGIGGGDGTYGGGDGGTITITGGTVTATGGKHSAGIGGGSRGSGGTITISGGTVTAYGRSSGAGIGGGLYGDGGTITISGGEVTATGSSGGTTGDIGGSAGIGGGEGGGGGTITISGGTVSATSGSVSGNFGMISGGGGAGIGGGLWGNGGTVVIRDAEVTAKGYYYAIGGGTNSLGSSGDRVGCNSITISNSVLNLSYEYSGGAEYQERIFDLELPEEVTVLPGSTLTLQTIARGASGLSYQWRCNGADIAGQTSATLSVPMTAEMDKTSFCCKVTNGYGNVAYTDYVHVFTLAFSQQPTPVELNLGDYEAVEARATCDNVTYHWERSYDEGVSWNVVPGEIYSTLLVEGGLSENGALYRCVITGTNGDQLASDAVPITVNTDDVTYTVKYYHQLPNGSGYGVAEQVVQVGTPNSAVTAPERTFEGFVENMAKGTVSGTVSTDEGLVLSRYYDRKEYSITLDMMGGGALPAITARYGAVVAAPADPVRYGYDFGGWYADKELTTPYTFTTMPLNGTTVYAKWVNMDEGRGIEYQINSILFRDADSYEELDSIPTRDFLVEVSVTNLSSTHMDTVLFVSYDKDGRMLGFHYAFANPTIGQTMTFGTAIDNEEGQVASVKVMVLSSLAGATPLAKAVEEM